MSNSPKTIQIYLPDGNARSVRIAEITSRTVQAILVPRNRLEEAGKRDEPKGVGVYFLFGEEEEQSESSVYIGEAENCYHRLKQHHRNKDFWKTAIIITSKTNSFTKAHAKYLEWYCHKKATDLNRFNLHNSTIPAKPYISEQMEADLMDNYETIRALISTLGFPILEEIKKSSKSTDMFFCKGKGLEARGQLVDDGFIVFAGSEMNVLESKSISKYLVDKRQHLIKDKLVITIKERYIFQKDILFSSPSQAAGVILGQSSNGWTAWKDSKGRTLDEVKRK